MPARTPTSRRRPAEPGDPRRHDRRPEQVELLLHRQRPQVQEHRRAAELVEVGLVGEDEVPVGDVPERRQGGPAQPRHLAVVEDDHVGQDHGHHHEERREQAAGAADPEPHQVDRAGGAPLGEQQRGDQVAADHQEDVDAQEAAGQPARPDVVGDDRRHGDRPQPVHPGHVRQTGSARRPGGAHAGAVPVRPEVRAAVTQSIVLGAWRRGRSGQRYRGFAGGAKPPALPATPRPSPACSPRSRRSRARARS